MVPGNLISSGTRSPRWSCDKSHYAFVHLLCCYSACGL